MHDLSVCNTWFQKKDIHLWTWQHPRSKAWHCINYAIVRQGHLRCVIDCHVFRRAECGTDHHLLCMTYRIPQSSGKRPRKPLQHRSKSFAVEKLLSAPAMSEDLVEVVNLTRAAYNDGVRQHLQGWAADWSLSEKWSTFKHAMTGPAHEVLGGRRRRQPDWFQENAIVIEPLLK